MEETIKLTLITIPVFFILFVCILYLARPKWILVNDKISRDRMIIYALTFALFISLIVLILLSTKNNISFMPIVENS